MNIKITGRGEDPKHWNYFIDGVQVSYEEYQQRSRIVRAKGSFGTGNWARPVVSDALAVNPRQIKAVQERNRKAGLHIDYKPDGRPILTNSGERQELMRLHGVHDNNGGYRAGGPRS